MLRTWESDRYDDNCKSFTTSPWYYHTMIDTNIKMIINSHWLITSVDTDEEIMSS